jgi:hypothetical protein
MRGIDVDKVRSEKKLSMKEFLGVYNEGLPTGFPRASLPHLENFREGNAGLFKDGLWSLDLHRKKFMDWLPAYLKSLEPSGS